MHDGQNVFYSRERLQVIRGRSFLDQTTPRIATNDHCWDRQ